MEPSPADARREELRAALYRQGAAIEDVDRYLAAAPVEDPAPPPRRSRRPVLVAVVAAAVLVAVAVVVVLPRTPHPSPAAPAAASPDIAATPLLDGTTAAQRASRSDLLFGVGAVEPEQRFFATVDPHLGSGTGFAEEHVHRGATGVGAATVPLLPVGSIAAGHTVRIVMLLDRPGSYAWDLTTQQRGGGRKLDLLGVGRQRGSEVTAVGLGLLPSREAVEITVHAAAGTRWLMEFVVT